MEAMALISDEYPDKDVQRIVADLVVRTRTSDSKPDEERFHKIMVELFGKQKRKSHKKRDDDHELLIKCAREFKKLKLKQGQEATACRNVVKENILFREVDVFYSGKPKKFDRDNKEEIDRVTQRLRDKLRLKKRTYTALADEEDLLDQLDHEERDKIERGE